MSSRLQLALNVNDIDQAVTFYSSCSAPSRPRSGPGTRTSPSPSRRSSSCCWRTPARAAASTTSASRSPTPIRSMPSRPASPEPGSPRLRQARPPAATPGRTSSGSRAHLTGSPGRSTPSWPTARPSTPKATDQDAAATAKVHTGDQAAQRPGAASRRALPRRGARRRQPDAAERPGRGIGVRARHAGSQRSLPGPVRGARRGG